MDQPDAALKYWIRSQRQVSRIAPHLEPAPSDEDFYLYACDQLDAERTERFLDWIKRHPEDQEFLAQLQERLAKNLHAGQAAPKAWIDRAKKIAGSAQALNCPHCKKAITPSKNAIGRLTWSAGIFGFVSLVSFVLSFYIKPYFFQCLTVTIVCGFKAILDQRARKTQILVYRALTGEATGAEHTRLHRTSSQL